jgi:hypothetical protein
LFYPDPRIAYNSGMLGKSHWQKIFLALAWLTIGPAVLADTSNGESVMNAFIATYAKEEVNWRSEVEFVNSPSEIPPGKQLGYSSVVGYFTFRPKSWDQLSVAEKEEVMGNPKLKAFLISLRSSNMPQYTNQVRRGLRVTRNIGAASPEEARLVEEIEEGSDSLPPAAPTSAPTPKASPSIRADNKSSLQSTPAPTPTPAPAPTPAPLLVEEAAPVKSFSIDAEDLVGNPDITIQLQ